MSTRTATVFDLLSDEDLDRLAEQLAPRLAARLAPAEDHWLDAAGAAEYLGLSLAALHRRTTKQARAKPGAIPCHQEAEGGKLHFLRSELTAWRRDDP